MRDRRRYIDRRVAGPRARPGWLRYWLVPMMPVAGRAELVDRGRGECLSWVQDHRGPVRIADVVRRIGIVLGLERERVRLAVRMPTRSHKVTNQEVARVELDARLGGVGPENPPARRILGHRGEL